jgi:pyruvate/2-oxoglutarate dehydrogenase complex dihydrolipoamide acyltransferase (E2) component
LLELDVTRPREIMRRHKAQMGESLSFTGFIITCLAQAIADNPAVQAYRAWRNRLVIFDDVDVVTLIEPHAGDVAVPHVIRAANLKTFRQIHDEIRAVQSRPTERAQTGGLVELAPRVPTVMRNLFYWALRQNPHWFKAIQGTAIVTAVGMFGQGSGWGIGFLPYHTLGLTLAGISSKPGVVNGRIEVREYLHLTISIDHDIVDGAPAARFAQQLKERIECGDGLCD